MRPKFKFWYKKESRWLLNVRIDNNGDIYPLDHNGDEDSGVDCRQIDIVPSVFLKDINGKDIYSGDLVKVTNKAAYNGVKVVVFDTRLLCYVLVWPEHYSAWAGSGCGDGYTYLKVSSGVRCKVIGNIYENPELIKGES